jgi:GNAT superfamily N-acetyltransferase
MVHPLLHVFLDAADGRFPPVDGGVTRIDPDGNVRAVVAFTGHAYVMAPGPIEPPDGVTRPDGFGGAFDPHFLVWLAGDRPLGVLDATLVARGTGGPTTSLEATDRWDAHPRVEHARQLRDDVRIFGDERGLVTLASGLAGRLELSVEAAPAGQGRGCGRSLVADALGLIDDGEPVFAAVSPGNARSLRVFLALGFTPIGSEIQWLAHT